MGVSKTTFLLWTIASLLVLIHAISTKEIVFITLVSVNLVSIITISILKIKYGEDVCGDCVVKCNIKKGRNLAIIGIILMSLGFLCNYHLNSEV